MTPLTPKPWVFWAGPLVQLLRLALHLRQDIYQPGQVFYQPRPPHPVLCLLVGRSLHLEAWLTAGNRERGSERLGLSA